MAQATESNTTRRTFLAGTAALVPAVLAAMPAHAADTVSITNPALEARLATACLAADEAKRRVGEAETNYQEWRDSHPEPPHLHGEDEYTPMAGHREWVQSRNAAMRGFGLARTKQAVYAAMQTHYDVCYEVVNLDAKSLPDLIYKARLTEWDNARGDIANSIVNDLLAIDDAAAA